MCIQLRKQGHQIVGIITAKEAEYYKKTAKDFETLAEYIGTRFWCGGINNEIISDLKSIQPDIAVSMNWISVIPKPFLDLFKYGVLNLHCGDLPRYKGNACPNWAILNGEKEIGITIHQMDEGLDSGPIILKRHIRLNNNTYISDVYEFIKENTSQMFIDALDLLSKGFVPKPQQGASLRCYTRRPSDSEIKWSDSAENIHRVIRASSHPFAGAYTFLEGHKFIIWRAGWTDTIGQEVCAIAGQIISVGQDTITASTGRGFLIITEYESKAKVKNTRQRFEGGG